MHFRTMIFAAALLAVPAAAEDKPKTDPATLVASGKPRQCLPLRDIQQSRPVGDSVIMFRTGANRWFRNDLRAPCPSLRDDRILVFRASVGSVCEMETVDLVDSFSRMNFGFCSLGSFTPVTVPKGTSF